MTPYLAFLFGLALGAALMAVLPLRWGSRLLVATLAAIVTYVFLGRVYAQGADIPPYPPPIVGVDTVAVRNPSCLMTWWPTRRMTCDRVFLDQFEVAK